MYSKVDILRLHLVPLVCHVGKSASFLQGLGIAYRLVYYFTLKANFLATKNMFLVECAWLCGQIEWESSSGLDSMP